MFVIVQITHKNSSYPMSYPMVKQKWEALKTLIKFNGFENLFLRRIKTLTIEIQLVRFFYLQYIPT